MTVLPHLAARLFGVPLAIHRPKLDVILAVLGPRVGMADLPSAAAYTRGCQSRATGNVATSSRDEVAEHLSVSAFTTVARSVQGGSARREARPGSEASCRLMAGSSALRNGRSELTEPPAK